MKNVTLFATVFYTENDVTLLNCHYEDNVPIL